MAKAGPRGWATIRRDKRCLLHDCGRVVEVNDYADAFSSRNGPTVFSCYIDAGEEQLGIHEIIICTLLSLPEHTGTYISNSIVIQ